MLLHPQQQLGQVTVTQHNEKGNAMSKTKEAKEVKTNNVVEPVDADTKAKEAIETLKAQLQEHLRQADHHRTMATKAQGALEVLLQLHPEENKEN